MMDDDDDLLRQALEATADFLRAMDIEPTPERTKNTFAFLKAFQNECWAMYVVAAAQDETAVRH